jgi:glycosyltransferase involved in cell wall biosynthesis
MWKTHHWIKLEWSCYEQKKGSDAHIFQSYKLRSGFSGVCVTQESTDVMETYAHIACLCTGREGYGIGHVLKTIACNFPGMLFVYQEDGPMSRWLCEHQMRTRQLESMVYYSIQPGQSTMSSLFKYCTLYFHMRKAAEDLKGILDAEKINIIHTHCLPNHLMISLLPKRHYRKIWHVHSIIDEKRLWGLNKAIYSIAVDRGATDLVCVSQYAMRQFNVKKAIKHVVHNGVEQVYSSPLNRDFKPPFHLMAAGRMVRYKGFHLCLAVFAAIRKQGLDAHLHICGGPLEGNSYYQELTNLSKMLGIAPDVTFHGFVSDIRQRNKQMHLALLLNTKTESCGIWVQEAMLDGLPVVATRCGGPEELIDDGQNGFLVSKTDTENQARAITRLLTDETFYRKISQAAYQKAAGKFTTQAFVENIRNIYGLKD